VSHCGAFVHACSPTHYRVYIGSLRFNYHEEQTLQTLAFILLTSVKELQLAKYVQPVREKSLLAQVVARERATIYRTGAVADCM